MIPLKLLMRNFMCYRDKVPPLVLEGVHVACLCGENGSGKSAILDAITWALWGFTSRGKVEDELVSIGRDEMEVELEFEVNGAKYRVVRKRDRALGKRAGHTLLEFQASGGSAYVPLTGNSTTETQRKITDTLRMDYATFVNSAFLVQGRADEFTTKTPDKRKEVLGKILNLGYYDRLEQRAREEARRGRDAVNALDVSIRDLESELSRREDVLTRLLQAQADLAERSQQLSGRQAEAEVLRSAKAAMEGKGAQARDLRDGMAALAAETQRLRLRIAEGQRDILKLQDVLADAETLNTKYVRLQDFLAKKEVFDAKAGAYMALSQEQARLEQLVAAQRARLESDKRLHQAQARDCQMLVSVKAKSAADLELAENELAALLQSEDRVVGLRQSLQEMEGEIGGLITANLTLVDSMKKAKALMDQFASGQGACPLCGTALAQDQCKDVLARYQAEGTEQGDAHRQNAARLNWLRTEQGKARQELTAIDERLRTRQGPLLGRTGSLRLMLTQADAAEAQLPLITSAVAEVERRLADKDFARDEHAALDQKRAALQDLGYDQDAHFQVREVCELMKPIEPRYRQLEDARIRLPEVQARLAEVVGDVAGRENGLKEGEAVLQQIAADLAALPKLSVDLQDWEREVRSLTEQTNALSRELGAAQGQLARLEQAEHTLAEKRQARKAAADGQSIYDDLVVAFGRRGVQALLIETALPEIEDEANYLLGRMTDQRMHVKLETQAALRTREGLQETLEIKISDELGTRSYETFSGGEAFRINVALRIALSRLLARRVGAPLPTLFIDEGFGTQDAQGREKVVETITAIQNEFQRILIITHIEEMKEQFPVRIEVVKTPEGSTFSIV